MTIIHPRTKRSKVPNTAANRKLAEDWEKLKAAHTKPLVKGAIANGIKIKSKTKQVPVLLTRPKLEVAEPPKKVLPIPLTNHTPGTKPAVDVLSSEKHALKARVGQVFNKGGAQYMTDSDLADAKAGLLRRRS